MTEKHRQSSEPPAPRPEELIVEALRQKTEAVSNGRNPVGVAMSRRNYDRIQRYHAGLGEAQGAVDDYIGKYTLFGMPIYIDNAVSCRLIFED